MLVSLLERLNIYTLMDNTDIIALQNEIKQQDLTP